MLLRDRLTKKSGDYCRDECGQGGTCPRREWVENIVEVARASGTPVYMKDSLLPIMGEENMLREFPWREAK